MTDSNTAFAGAIPARYDEYLGPLLFELYATDLVSRLSIEPGDAVLELASGTGIATVRTVAAMPRGASLTATDLNEAMLALARERIDPSEPVTWKTADAGALPFGDDWFDTVLCQFGLMFFPDKAAALREVLRVLHPGGAFVFNVWGTLDENPIARIAHQTIARYFRSDPPTFYHVPFSMADVGATMALLQSAGFEEIQTTPVALQAQSESARHAAIGLVTGQPVVLAIEERATAKVDEIITAVEAALAAEGGASPLRLPMLAHIFTARRP